jgi:hypothetical protein
VGHGGNKSVLEFDSHKKNKPADKIRSEKIAIISIKHLPSTTRQALSQPPEQNIK